MTSTTPTDGKTLAGDGLPPIRAVIEANGLWADKALGQNFILDLNLTRKIARLASPLEAKTIVEVGPGPGGLTRGLLAEGAGDVIAIERDERCRPALAEIAHHYPGRLKVHYGDALDATWQTLLAGHSAPVTVVANLPYGIATRLLVGWLETEPWPPWYAGLVLMFQKEVAERIVASPGTKAYGRLSVIAQWRCETRLALTLPAAAFTPQPKVASAIVVFTPRPAPTPTCSVATLARVTAACFGQRRKMLRHSLRQIVPQPDLLLRQAGIDPERRCEQMTPAEFALLTQILDRT